jgi:hypothetical protein
MPSRSTEQRLALDAVLCGGLIRGKGARLRIRHRLAPLPLAAPRDAAFAAPPASPSPKCGISGIHAADSRIVRLIEPSVPACSKASCQLHPRHPCRGAVAAFEINARCDRGQRRRLSRRHVLRQVSAPAAAALRGSSSAPLAACRVRSVVAMAALVPRSQRPASLRSGRGRPRAWHPAICMAAASCRRSKPQTVQVQFESPPAGSPLAIGGRRLDTHAINTDPHASRLHREVEARRPRAIYRPLPDAREP